ncbi:hypothetical protein [Tengunoibacter tsumagoiensis]|uniref:Uncharacterized protein n=1 Tax=Tengunoibacter tsumagoiensis TaxID=2014871 RepID=A0A402A550_9CHLR|nr:hypothetical protein [Tengunoibacter tsumagoiensis]GCE14131.1 hypothetical protein KTT_39900 [Tengunoibacter tsumagoiensis]
MRKYTIRKQLLEGVKAFLENSASADKRATTIIQHCYDFLSTEEKLLTLDEMVWRFLAVELSDSVFYQNKTYLQELYDILTGKKSHNFSRCVFQEDYQCYFTNDEREWFTALEELAHFITSIPYEKVYQMRGQTHKREGDRTSEENNHSMALSIDEIDDNYQTKKERVESLSKNCPSPVSIGDEKIYHLLLREITTILTGLTIGKAVAAFGYPIADGSFSRYGDVVSSGPFNMTENLLWANKALEVLLGKRALFLSWRWSIDPLSDTESLLISIH